MALKLVDISAKILQFQNKNIKETVALLKRLSDIQDMVLHSLNVDAATANDTEPNNQSNFFMNH